MGVTHGPHGAAAATSTEQLFGPPECHLSEMSINDRTFKKMFPVCILRNVETRSRHVFYGYREMWLMFVVRRLHSKMDHRR